MTLKQDPDLDIQKMYPYTKKKLQVGPFNSYSNLKYEKSVKVKGQMLSASNHLRYEGS